MRSEHDAHEALRATTEGQRELLRIWKEIQADKEVAETEWEPIPDWIAGLLLLGCALASWGTLYVLTLIFS